jgi:Zn-dependent M28 family amino/carboxypeptidase
LRRTIWPAAAPARRARPRRAPERFIVVSAHYDHLGVRDGKIYNGADDNASGVAALLALAEHFARRPPEHSIIFVAFDAEEMGSPGAKAFVERPPVPRASLALNVNLDMVARGDKGELYVAGTHPWPFLRPSLEAAAVNAPVTVRFGHDTPDLKGSDNWIEGSDHRVFNAAGIPFAYFGVEDHPDYHQPTDHSDKIPADFFGRSVQTLVGALTRLDRDLDAIVRAHALQPKPR